MKVIITRHGRTKENEQEILQGQMDGTLSDEGVLQANKLAEYLKTYVFDVIITSDLARAYETTLILGKYHTDTSIIITEALREQHLGDYQGAVLGDIEWNEENKVGSMIQPPNGESLEALYERAKRFLGYVKNHYSEGIVLLVGHDGINRAMMAVLEDKSKTEYPFESAQRNTAVNEIDIDQMGNVHVIRKNYTEHLEN